LHDRVQKNENSSVTVWQLFKGNILVRVCVFGIHGVSEIYDV
jgi:hypothetical protein